jgi:hypothetical protein
LKSFEKFLSGIKQHVCCSSQHIDIIGPEGDPTPKIVNIYFKLDFDSFFFFRYAIKFPACFFSNGIDLAHMVSEVKGL